jgi:formamidopyrimidine-DNA glycosylase
MPELPEVETTRRGIAAHVIGLPIARVIVRQRRLRWPVPHVLQRRLRGSAFTRVDRRAKYLLLHTPHGCLIAHLGMSGSLRVTTAELPPGKHDHVDIVFADGQCLRFRDPRRFGSLLWTDDEPERHPLLRRLGPEPLAAQFSGPSLHVPARGRRIAVKNFLMDSHVVVGVGNIYASEALFVAGISPRRAAGRVSAAEYERLAQAIRRVLQRAIRKGGTTLRDFAGSNGEPGYFGQELGVYERAGRPCRRCRTPIRHLRQGQRSTYYCPSCQR